jgi:putative SOS response-associated peptidase YedK
MTMCGRFTLRTPVADIAEIFGVLRLDESENRYNIAPSQAVPVVRQNGPSRELTLMRWGLIPRWARDPKIGLRTINARAETVATKPAFRDAFKRRRCLIPADGFYEWKKDGSKKKRPFYIHRRDGRPFGFAGLWERWERADSKPIESCTVITTDANDVLQDLHDRMPVILPEESYDRWLDPKWKDDAKLSAMLTPFPGNELTLFEVSPVVNNPRNETAECIAPLEIQLQLDLPEQSPSNCEP